MDLEKCKEAMQEAIADLRFCVELYKIQMDHGRYFLHEHPLTALSWKVKCMRDLVKHPDVKVVVGHMCAHGMTLDHNGRKEKVYKPTGWCSNSHYIRNHMQKLCDRTHTHISLQRGRAKHVAIYPTSLCLSILRGIKD